MLPTHWHGLEDQQEADAEQAVTVVVTTTERGRASPKQMECSSVIFFLSFSSELCSAPAPIEISQWGEGNLESKELPLCLHEEARPI